MTTEPKPEKGLTLPTDPDEQIIGDPDSWSEEMNTADQGIFWFVWR